MADTTTKLENWQTVKTDGFINLMGPLLRSTQLEERNVFGLLTNETHRNHIGIVHGGVLTSLFDQVIAIVAWNAANRQPTVTVQMDTRFLGAAKVGDFLKIRPEIRHATRSLMFVDAEITTENRIIASASAIMKITASTGKTA